MDMCKREMIDMYLDDIVSSSSGLIRPAYIVGMVCKHPRTRLEVLVQRGLIHLRWSVDDGTRVLSNALGGFRLATTVSSYSEEWWWECQGRVLTFFVCSDVLLR